MRNCLGYKVWVKALLPAKVCEEQPLTVEYLKLIHFPRYCCRKHTTSLWLGGLWTQFLLGYEYNSFHLKKHVLLHYSYSIVLEGWWSVQMDRMKPECILQAKPTVFHILWEALPFTNKRSLQEAFSARNPCYFLHIALPFLRPVMLEEKLGSCKPQSPEAQKKRCFFHLESTMLFHPTNCYGTLKVTFRSIAN